MKNICVLVAVVIASFGVQSVVQAQSSSTSSSAREQAVARLRQLVDTYDVSLNEFEQDSVQTICRELQSSTIDTFSDQIRPTEQRYTKAVETMSSNVTFTINSLSEMSEDSSNLDLARIHLRELRQDFEDTVEPYEKILDELLIIDCQLFPELFVAGLEEARFRRLLVVNSAEEILKFRDGELKDAFDKVEQRLIEIERARTAEQGLL